MTNLTAALVQARQQRQPRKRRAEEHGFQVALIQFLELALPSDAILTSLDHADASAAQRASRARRGVKNGIADILITWQPDKTQKLQTVVWLEAKRRTGGKLSDEQIIWRDHVIAAGHYWGSPRTIEDAKAVLESTGIPLRKVHL